MASHVEEVDYKNDPGSAKYGNFMNYYQFNLPSERINVLPPNLLNEITEPKQNKVICLDIGCNTGDLTRAVYDHLVKNDSFEPKVSVLGIDLDPVLIERAKENKFPSNIDYEVCDFMNTKDHEKLSRYLSQFETDKFDIVFCFSVTMWVHLNHGDEGLKTFLSNASRISKSILIEPQPWKCYLSATRRMRRLKQTDLTNVDHLIIRKNIVDFIVEFLTKECNMIMTYQSLNTKWGRKLFLFKEKL